MPHKTQASHARGATKANSPAVSLLTAPRTDPCERNSRTRLLPRVSDAEALSGPGVGYPRLGQPAIGQPFHAPPRRTVPLATPAQGASPEFDDVVAECRQGAGVTGHGMVGEVAPHDRSQPLPLFGGVLVPAPPEFLLDR